jgi:hypothetical protein
LPEHTSNRLDRATAPMLAVSAAICTSVGTGRNASIWSPATTTASNPAAAPISQSYWRSL